MQQRYTDFTQVSIVKLGKARVMRGTTSYSFIENIRYQLLGTTLEFSIYYVELRNGFKDFGNNFRVSGPWNFQSTLCGSFEVNIKFISVFICFASKWLSGAVVRLKTMQFLKTQNSLSRKNYNHSQTWIYFCQGITTNQEAANKTLGINREDIITFV